MVLEASTQVSTEHVSAVSVKLPPFWCWTHNCGLPRLKPNFRQAVFRHRGQNSTTWLPLFHQMLLPRTWPNPYSSRHTAIRLVTSAAGAENSCQNVVAFNSCWAVRTSRTLLPRTSYINCGCWEGRQPKTRRTLYFMIFFPRGCRRIFAWRWRLVKLPFHYKNWWNRLNVWQRLVLHLHPCQAVTSLEEVSCGEVNQLQSDVADLKKFLQTFAATSRKKAPSSQERKWPTSSTGSASNLCSYHYRYGEAARKCRPPCSHVGNFKAKCWWRRAFLAHSFLVAYFLLLTVLPVPVFW